MKIKFTLGSNGIISNKHQQSTSSEQVLFN